MKATQNETLDKFKVGDKVRVVVSGAVGEVIIVNSGWHPAKPYYVLFNLMPIRIWFAASELELVKEK